MLGTVRGAGTAVLSVCIDEETISEITAVLPVP